MQKERTQKDLLFQEINVIRGISGVVNHYSPFMDESAICQEVRENHELKCDFC